MTAPELQHGKDWERENLAGWWLSEKLDGWRAVWTGSELFTRQGNRYNAPAWWLAGLPAHPLDCELVTVGQTTHSAVASAVRRGDWHNLALRAFDIPIEGTTTEAAHAMLAAMQFPPHVKPVTFTRAPSTAAAWTVARQIVRDGGEGVMARRPGSAYQTLVRSDDLLKLKTPIP